MLSRKKTVEGLLDAGVQVALVYGDRDFRSDCMHDILSIRPKFGETHPKLTITTIHRDRRGKTISRPELRPFHLVPIRRLRAGDNNQKQ